MKILTVCPSLRKNKLRDMMESFNKTKSCDNTLLIDSETITTTKAINKAFKENTNYDFYHIANDDIIYHTKGWDKILTSKPGINYASDLFQNRNHPTFPMISSEIVRALGWLQCPTVEYLYGDSVWKNIGEQLGCLNYFPGVIIEHRHFLKTCHTDEVYAKTNSEEQYRKDQFGFVNWLTEQSHRDIERVRKALNDVQERT